MDQLVASLTFDGAGPVYKRLAHAIADAIRSGRIEEGAPMPPERNLANDLGVSRVTVRSAYRDLVASGLMETRPGSGNYVRVSHQPLIQPLWRLTSFSDDMARGGQKPTNRLLELTRAIASAPERKALNLEEDAGVVRLRRLRLADGLPLAIEAATLPETLVRDVHLGEGSLYAALAEQGVGPARGVQRMRAVSLEEDAARLLSVQPGTAGMLCERVAYLPDGRPIEYTVSHYRGDAFDFVAQLDIGGRS
ncbi:GntR family transcriptional regulator [Mesorhizobium sp. CAU 1741]|uniref:GntR family transcriptional regulator n=1 Tax=Mesorhizobium sp. CAU 1741 TaxID=3140366 RepID=UPI00325C0D67